MITIRKAKQEDREFIWRIHTRAIKDLCKSHYTREELCAWSGVLRPGRYDKAINSTAFFVAEERDVIVGFGNLNQEKGEVEALYVDPGHVRRGVGMKILQSLEGVARDLGLGSLHLLSALNAVPFYENAGYQSQQQSKCLLPFGMVACVPMRKELPA